MHYTDLLPVCLHTLILVDIQEERACDKKKIESSPVCCDVALFRQHSEWVREGGRERGSERASDLMWVSDRPTYRPSERVSDRVSDRDSKLSTHHHPTTHSLVELWGCVWKRVRGVRSEWGREGGSEWVGEQASEWVGKRASGWVGEWVSERASGRAGERARGGWVSEWVSERASERVGASEPSEWPGFQAIDPPPPNYPHPRLQPQPQLYFHPLLRYRPVSQMRAPLVACRELILNYNTLPKLLYVFENKTFYVLIHAQYNRTVVFWHIINIPPMLSSSQFWCNTTTFCIAAIFVKYCYTTSSWLL